MTPEQHNRAKQIFLAACERSPEHRRAYVDQECADDAVLREHVESLLLHHTAHPAETRRNAGDEGSHPSSQPASEPATGELAPGSLIAQRYQIVSLLGRGGMGEVYLANDQLLQQRVALKFLSPELAGDPAWVVRLVREVRAARRVTNSTVCRVFDIQIGDDGPAFISMEYVDGESLSSLLRRIGRLPTEKALDIARQICTGLCAAHAVGLLHRDLKPSNIMIDGDGAVRIMDFGLASPRAQISDTEIRAGTPAYMAPELYAGTDVSIRSDIYALGLVLFELFAGRPAFDGQSYTELARLHQRASPPSLGEVAPNVPPAVEQVIRRCLEKDPQRRPESALAVAADLPDTNPLAIAAAAGVTPTARQVASAGSHDLLPRGSALGLLAGLAVLLGAVAWLGQGSGVWPEMQDSKPPAVLLESARAFCDRLGTPTTKRYEASRFTYHASNEYFAAELGIGEAEAGAAAPPNAETTRRLASGEPQAYSFWYRRRAIGLTPRNPLNITFGGACALARA
jgi:serine/threonine-protein kinase